jgi:hypothetical protein
MRDDLPTFSVHHPVFVHAALPVFLGFLAQVHAAGGGAHHLDDQDGTSPDGHALSLFGRFGRQHEEVGLPHHFGQHLHRRRPHQDLPPTLRLTVAIEKPKEEADQVLMLSGGGGVHHHLAADVFPASGFRGLRQVALQGPAPHSHQVGAGDRFLLHIHPHHRHPASFDPDPQAPIFSLPV